MTDTGGTFLFGDYLGLQIVSAIVAVGLVGVIAAPVMGDASGWIVAAAIVVGQSFVIVRDVHIALGQKHECFNYVAVSRILSGLISLVAMSVLLVATNSLIAGVVGLQGAKIATYFAWDIPQTRKIALERGHSLRPLWRPAVLRRLAMSAVPLASGTAVAAVAGNVPRYAVKIWCGDGPLGFFAGTAALAQAGNLVIGALGLAALPRLRDSHKLEARRFKAILVKLVVAVMLLGATGLCAAILLGEEILRIAFSEEFVPHRDLFVWMMAASMIGYPAAVLQQGLAAMRKFRGSLVADVTNLLFVLLGTLVLVPSVGMLGAPLAIAAGAAGSVIVSIACMVACSHASQRKV